MVNAAAVISIAALLVAMVGLLVSRSLGARVQAATLLVAALLLLGGSIAELAVDSHPRGWGGVGFGGAGAVVASIFLWRERNVPAPTPPPWRSVIRRLVALAFAIAWIAIGITWLSWLAAAAALSLLAADLLIDERGKRRR
jgi:hypothetical protein